MKIEPGDSRKNQPKAPNEIWHIDISYIPCGLNANGKTLFWYLVVVLDGYSWYVISWDLFPDMTKERCFEVVDQAIRYLSLKIISCHRADGIKRKGIYYDK